MNNDYLGIAAKGRTHFWLGYTTWFCLPLVYRLFAGHVIPTILPHFSSLSFPLLPPMQLSLLAVPTTGCSDHQAKVCFAFYLFIFNVSQAVQNQALWADEPCFYSAVWGWPAINRSVGQSRSFNFYPVTYVILRHIKVWEITTPPHCPLNSVGYRKGTY